MKYYYHLLLLCAIALSTSVTAKSPPGPGWNQVSKNHCPEFSYCEPLLHTAHIIKTLAYAEVYIYEPEKLGSYTKPTAKIYASPYVERAAAFYARSSC